MAINIGVLQGTIALKDDFTSVIKSAGDSLEESSKKLTRLGQSMSSLGSTLSRRITLPLLALGAVSTKFATDFESSFAGVRKTVDDAGDQFGEFAQSFRDLSKEIPIATTELLSIGEAAGQLGISTPNILEFTRVMANLGVTTNLSSIEAATALARLANITQLPQTEFERLGSTIVALGNNFATTESEIVEMALRLAGVGTSIGLTEGQILALSTALSSVGVRAEAGGSAFSRVMRDMSVAAATGGEAVRLFASISGKSIEDFARIFREDASKALTLFVEGLGRMTNAERIRALDELGFSGIRVSDSLTRLSGAGDLLFKTMNLQATAWAENTALAEEAAERYKTFESRVTILWNRMKDLGVTFGQIIIPLLDKMIIAVSPLIDKFQGMSKEFQTAVLIGGSMAAALGPLLIIFGQMVIGATALGISFASVSAAATGFIAVLAAINPLLSIILVTVVAVASAITKWRNDLTRDIDNIISSMNNFTDSIKAVGDAVNAVVAGGDIQEMSRLLGVQQTRLDELIVVIEDAKSEMRALSIEEDRAAETGNLHGQVLEIIRDKQAAASKAYREANGELAALEKSTKELKDGMRKWVPVIVDAGGAVDDLADGADKINVKFSTLHGQLDRVLDMTQNNTRSFNQLGKEIGETSKASKLLNEITNLSSDRMGELGGLVSLLRIEMEKTGKVTNEQLNVALDTLRNRLERSDSAVVGLAESLDNELSRALEGIIGRISQVGGMIGNAFGASTQALFSKFNDIAQSGFAVWDSFIQGDAIGLAVNGFSALKGVFDSLFPSTKLVEERVTELLDKLESGQGTLEDFKNLTFDLTRSMEKAAEGWGEGGRALALMEENFSRFVDVAREQGPEGLKAIEELVEAAKAAGVGLQVIADKLREVWNEAAAVIEDRNHFILNQVESLVDGLNQFIGDITTATTRDIEFAATSVMAAFNQMVAAGAPIGDIVATLGDMFQDLKDRGIELGTELGAEFASLGNMLSILAEDKFVRVIEKLKGMQAAVTALGNMGDLSREQFFRFQNQILSTFSQLEAGGLTGAQALAAIAPQLQTLQDLSQQYGLTVNENTQALLDEAAASGLVADRALTTEDILIKGFDRILESLNAVIVALGGVPVALNSWATSADDLADRMGQLGDQGVDIADDLRDAWNTATDAINASGSAANNAAGNTPPPPGFSHGSGKFINFGGGTTAILHGREQVINVGEGKSIAAMVSAAISNAGRADSSGSFASSMIEELLRDQTLAIVEQTAAIRERNDGMLAIQAREATGR